MGELALAFNRQSNLRGLRLVKGVEVQRLWGRDCQQEGSGGDSPVLREPERLIDGPLLELDMAWTGANS